jgi:hypothetical protein
MTLKLEFPPELESRLRKEAAKRGMSVDQCAQLLLQDQLALTTETSTPDVRALRKTPEESLRAFHELLDFIKSLNIPAPSIPAEALRRENLYEDRGL